MNKKIYVNSSRHGRIISVSNILYFAAAGDKVEIHYEQKGREEVSEFSGVLKEVEKRLADEGFCRIHRCFIINLEKIVLVKENSVTIDPDLLITLPVGRTYADVLPGRLKSMKNRIIML